MKAVILTVAIPGTQALVDLCRESVRKFAPGIYHAVWWHDKSHAEGIEMWRRRMRQFDDRWDVVVLMDSDVVLTSARWGEAMLEPFQQTVVELAGAPKHSGPVERVLYGAATILHPSCLAMRRELFDKCDFAPQGRLLDTAGMASLLTSAPKIFRFHPIGSGPLFPGLDVGEFFDPDDPRQRTLWVHLLHGSNMWGSTGLWQQTKALLSPRAKTVLRRRRTQAAWMRRAWEIVRQA